MNITSFKQYSVEAGSTFCHGLLESLPYMPTYGHLLVAALMPIVAGAFGSLSRPSNCAPKPPREKKSSEESEDDEDEEEEEETPLRENLSNWDALGFPVVAGMALLVLYLLLKYTSAVLLNKIMSTYLTLMSVFAVGRLLEDFLGIVQDFVFPKGWRDLGGNTYRIKHNSVTKDDKGVPDAAVCAYGHLVGPYLSSGQRMSLYNIKAWMKANIKVNITASHKKNEPILFSLHYKSVLGYGLSVPLILTYYFWSGRKPWFLTNILGTAFSYTAIQLLSPASFPTASLLLMALFIYDIFFVFYTPLMVTVATQLDIPIKMLFPRPPDASALPGSPPALAMLGLGDIVLPGIVIALALRFDLWRHYEQIKLARRSASINEQKQASVAQTVNGKPENDWKPVYQPATGNWGTNFWMRSNMFMRGMMGKKAYINGQFAKPYFSIAIFGYVVGMATTIIVMHVFEHAQPALLYLVPSVLLSIWITGAVKGELHWLWSYSELEDEEEEKNGKTRQDQILGKTKSILE